MVEPGSFIDRATDKIEPFVNVTMMAVIAFVFLYFWVMLILLLISLVLYAADLFAPFFDVMLQYLEHILTIL